GTGDHGRQILEHTARLRVRVEDGCEKRAVASAHVDDSPKLREIVCCDDFGDIRRHRAHGSIENRSILGILREVSEKRGSVHALECYLPCPNALVEEADWLPNEARAQH